MFELVFPQELCDYHVISFSLIVIKLIFVTRINYRAISPTAAAPTAKKSGGSRSRALTNENENAKAGCDKDFPNKRRCIFYKRPTWITRWMVITKCTGWHRMACCCSLFLLLLLSLSFFSADLTIWWVALCRVWCMIIDDGGVHGGRVSVSLLWW